MHFLRLRGTGRPAGLALIAATVLALSACGGDSGPVGRWNAVGGQGGGPGPAESPVADTSLAVAVVAPADGATTVPTSTEITLATTGTVGSVSLVGPDGRAVPGALAASGRTWIPFRQLGYGARYRVSVTAHSGTGARTATTAFTTMPRPSALNGADLYVRDGDVVGVGLPIVVEFVRKVPAGMRASIERRLFVRSTPAVVGSWHWFSDNEVHFRPRTYWPVGTKVSVRVAVGGLPMGNGTYGRRDRVATFTVGSAVISRVDNATKKMSVFKDGKFLRSFPISMGRPRYPTSSGVHVVMDKAPEVMFDSSTYGLPVDSPDGYRQKVYWDVRFTWGGEFVHAAPWSVADQGRRNVSHGCVNAAPRNAKWFYELSKKGDLIEIVGTERRVASGDGWTDWTMTWERYVAGSALRRPGS